MLNIKAILLSLVAVFAPIKAIMLAAFVLVISDLITGILAARHRKEPITSAGLQRTLIKTFIYQAAIVLGYTTQTYLTGDLMPVSKIITSYVGLTEMLSILENLNEISSGSLFKTVIDKLRSNNDIEKK